MFPGGGEGGRGTNWRCVCGEPGGDCADVEERGCQAHGCVGQSFQISVRENRSWPRGGRQYGSTHTTLSPLGVGLPDPSLVKMILGGKTLSQDNQQLEECGIGPASRVLIMRNGGTAVAGNQARESYDNQGLDLRT